MVSIARRKPLTIVGIVAMVVVAIVGLFLGGVNEEGDVSDLGGELVNGRHVFRLRPVC